MNTARIIELFKHPALLDRETLIAHALSNVEKIKVSYHDDEPVL